MSDAGGKIKIDGDASGFVAATGEVKKAAEGLNESLKSAIGGGAKAAEKSMVAMSQEGRKACKRLNAGIINMSTYVMGAQAGLNLLSRAWGKFGDVIKSGEDVGRVTRRLEAFTGGARSAAEAARAVVSFADTPPFGLEETQRAAQLLLGCGVRVSELKDVLESLGNVAAGGGVSLETVAVRLSKVLP